MLRTLSTVWEKSRYLRPTQTSLVLKRTTVIVKRVHKPPLVTGPGITQRQIDQSGAPRVEDAKYVIYSVEEPRQPEHEVKLILMRTVDTYGKKGQIVSVRYKFAHKHLLIPGFAVYHTEENLEKYKDILIPENIQHHSSESSRILMNYWSARVLDVIMNMDVPWTIEKWHIRVALRKHGLWTSEDRITIPGGEISGPDLSLDGKEFVSVVDVSHLEKLKIRCRIHHYSNEREQNRDAELSPAWYLKMAEPVWEHERLELLNMSKAPPSRKLNKEPGLKKEIEEYNQWRREREIRLQNV